MVVQGERSWTDWSGCLVVRRHLNPCSDSEPGLTAKDAKDATGGQSGGVRLATSRDCQ